MRDSNLERELPRNCLFSSKLYDVNNNFDFDVQVADNIESIVCDWYLGSGMQNKVLQIVMDPEKYYTIKPVEYFADFEKDRTQNRLSSGGDFAFFARYLLFTGIVENEKILPQDKIMKVESHVLYKKGAMTGDVVLESFIWQQ